MCQQPTLSYSKRFALRASQNEEKEPRRGRGSFVCAGQLGRLEATLCPVGSSHDPMVAATRAARAAGGSHDLQAPLPAIAVCIRKSVDFGPVRIG